MQDRFRFRIWDKPTSKMFYNVCIGFIKAPMRSDWVCVDTSDGQISYTGDRLKDIEIMQKVYPRRLQTMLNLQRDKTLTGILYKREKT